jgi:hypothetical protein
MTADEVMAAEVASTNDRGFPREEARDFLKQILADGPVDVTEVNKQAEKLGIAERTLKRARGDLKIKAKKNDFDSGWSLRLPDEEGHSTPKGAT